VRGEPRRRYDAQSQELRRAQLAVVGRRGLELRPVDVEVGIPHVHDTTTVARHADADRVRSRAHLGAPGVLKRAKLIRAVEWDFRDHPAGAGGAKEGVASRIAERAVNLAAKMRKPASCKQDGRNGDEHHRLLATRLRSRDVERLGVDLNPARGRSRRQSRSCLVGIPGKSPELLNSVRSM